MRKSEEAHEWARYAMIAKTYPVKQLAEQKKQEIDDLKRWITKTVKEENLRESVKRMEVMSNQWDSPAELGIKRLKAAEEIKAMQQTCLQVNERTLWGVNTRKLGR